MIMDVWLPVLCFFLGLLFSWLVYSLLVCFTEEENKLIVFKSKRLSKRERIENLEKENCLLTSQIQYIKGELYEINCKLSGKKRGKF